jgi:hypothetical protein
MLVLGSGDGSQRESQGPLWAVQLLLLMRISTTTILLNNKDLLSHALAIIYSHLQAVHLQVQKIVQNVQCHMSVE